MCYTVYLSTNSNEDLTAENTDLLRFKKLDDSRNMSIQELLVFPNRWHVGSKSICSCTFRHLSSIDLGFGEPEDWYPEEQDELDAAKLFYKVVYRLFSSNFKTDCIDFWEGAESKEIRQIQVSFDKVTEPAFRFFENYRFEFV